MAEAINRYTAAKANFDKADAAFAEGLKRQSAAWLRGDIGKGKGGGGLSIVAMGRRASARRELDAAKYDYDRYNSMTASQNQQILQQSMAQNQMAALKDVEAQGEAAKLSPEAQIMDPADPVAAGAADTGTPGGTSGRRRRGIIETGSIRI